MNSFNHYAYGAIGDWMYNTIAGINTDPVATGYKKIIIKPRPGGGLEKVSAELETYYGKIDSRWTRTDGKLQLDVAIPPNTSATVYLPSAGIHSVTERGRSLTIGEGIKRIRQEAGYTLVVIGSGTYSFVAQWRPAAN
jgi:alpha-L-rhamnosidase